MTHTAKSYVYPIANTKLSCTLKAMVQILSIMYKDK